MRFVLISQAFRARLSSKVYETTEAAQDTPVAFDSMCFATLSP